MDDYFNPAQDSQAANVALDLPANSDYSGGVSINNDVWDSVSSAFGDTSPSWLTQDFMPSSDDNSYQTNEDKRFKAATQQVQADTGPGLVERAAGYFDKNQGLAKVGLNFIGGMAASQSRKESEARAAQIKRDEQARINSSVTGLRPRGLISKQMPLQRVDGTQIYNNGTLKAN